MKSFLELRHLTFCANSLEKYFSRKLQKVSFSRDANPCLLLTKVFNSSLDIKKEDILQKGHTYEVKSGSFTYILDVKSSVCSCEARLYGRFCEHQCAIFHHFDAASKMFSPVSPDDRYQVALIVLLQKCPDKSLFQTFFPKET
ncbi:hypothetical protein AVEN_197196-1 [Araneus ventricosus]|uniref:SWIM-type domain-containing protein n=1 Tax=Araneus ventricosus TaxID=182803 RepID=A0A4Y2N759_ARAVE|nr:hypothetical protein AVEN_197196-1 [Araneus ventricosus]